jgi:hypothetical protein
MLREYSTAAHSPLAEELQFAAPAEEVLRQACVLPAHAIPALSVGPSSQEAHLDQMSEVMDPTVHAVQCNGGAMAGVLHQPGVAVIDMATDSSGTPTVGVPELPDSLCAPGGVVETIFGDQQIGDSTHQMENGHCENGELKQGLKGLAAVGGPSLAPEGPQCGQNGEGLCLPDGGRPEAGGGPMAGEASKRLFTLLGVYSWRAEPKACIGAHVIKSLPPAVQSAQPLFGPNPSAPRTACWRYPVGHGKIFSSLDDNTDAMAMIRIPTETQKCTTGNPTPSRDSSGAPRWAPITILVLPPRPQTRLGSEGSTGGTPGSEAAAASCSKSVGASASTSKKDESEPQHQDSPIVNPGEGWLAEAEEQLQLRDGRGYGDGPDLGIGHLQCVLLLLTRTGCGITARQKLKVEAALEHFDGSQPVSPHPSLDLLSMVGMDAGS